jgi:drug/metabolite transporter (DMT)-like permease
MSNAVLLLVIASAFAHAGWNFLLKQSHHKTAFLWSFTIVAFAGMLVPAIVFVAIDGLTWKAVMFGAVSGVLHGAYGFSLASGYRAGDLSAVYPISRGMGTALIPAFAVLFLGETVSRQAAVGIGIIVAGIYTIQLESLTPAGLLRPLRALSHPASRLAIITGLFIAGYSLWDKEALDELRPVVLNEFSLFGYLVLLLPLALREGGDQLRLEWRERWPSIIAAGVLSPLAYLLVLFALETTRIAYVAPVREVGIVIGAILGVTLLGESYGAARITGSLLIVAGVLTLGLAP